MITIEDARSGNDVPIDELLEFECHGVFFRNRQYANNANRRNEFKK